MLHRLRNVWRPANFHLHHRIERGGGYFEGWYFKVVDDAGAQPLALIPGVFLGDDAHAFIQVLDGCGGRSWYHRYPLDAFHADRHEFSVSIAGCRFDASGVHLHIDAGDTDAKQSLKGSLRFGPFWPWPVTPLSPGVMGPYSFAPFMECKHGILSLDHSVEGALVMDGRETGYDGGRGYVEKDWGRAFPTGYVWAQSNHFDRPGVSVSASVATIPWLTGRFRGFLVGVLVDGQLVRFTTYTGAHIEELVLTDDHLELVMGDRRHRLQLRARKTDGALLHAPYEQQMLERVAETMTSEVEVRLTERKGDRVVYEGRGQHGCLEMQGDLASVVDDAPQPAA